MAVFLSVYDHNVRLFGRYRDLLAMKANNSPLLLHIDGGGATLIRASIQLVFLLSLLLVVRICESHGICWPPATLTIYQKL